ncbi:MAG: hypothetical protein QM619_05810, partial [Micropruina sp.]|uniref:hypothetical protein n=1 Tax=Micropruina sp. TaxID=2737536 RepID=UPI0039E56225
ADGGATGDPNRPGAAGCSSLVIVMVIPLIVGGITYTDHLTPPVQNLGADYHANRTDKDRRTRNHIRQLEALGFRVTLEPAA